MTGGGQAVTGQSGFGKFLGNFGGPLLGFGIDMLSNLLSGQSNKKAMKRQHTYNKYYMSEQDRLNREYWNMQNEYNTPAQQMARLKAAGLNPHLMYGQGNVGNAEKVGSVGSPGSSALAHKWNLGNVLSNYTNLKTTNANVDNVRQLTRNAQVEEQNKRLDGMLKALEGKGREQQIIKDKIINNYLAESMNLDNQNKRQDLLNKAEQLNLTSKQVQKTIQEIDLTKQDVKVMTELGISRNSPVIMKNVKYLAYQMGLSPETVIQIAGGVVGLNMVFKGISAVKGIGRKTPVNKGTETVKWKKGSTWYSETRPIDY